MFENVTRETDWSLLPSIVGLPSAESALKQGASVAYLIAAVTSVLALYSILTGSQVLAIDGWGLVDGVIFALIGWGIRRKSRCAAVLGLSLHVLNQIISMAERGGVGGFIVFLLFLAAFVNSVRGTFGYHKYHAQLRSDVITSMDARATGSDPVAMNQS